MTLSSNGQIQTCDSKYIEYLFGFSKESLKKLEITKLIPGFFDSFDYDVSNSSLNSLTINEDFKTSTPAKPGKYKTVEETEEEFPTGSFYGYAQHRNGDEISKIYDYIVLLHILLFDKALKEKRIFLRSICTFFSCALFLRFHCFAF